MPELWAGGIMGFTKSSNVRIAGGPVTFYVEYELTNAYVEKPFSTNINTITITNDSDPDAGNDVCQVSWNSAIREGDIKAGESMTFNVSTKTSVFLKGTAGGENIRCWGW